MLVGHSCERHSQYGSSGHDVFVPSDSGGNLASSEATADVQQELEREKEQDAKEVGNLNGSSEGVGGSEKLVEAQWDKDYKK